MELLSRGLVSSPWVELIPLTISVVILAGCATLLASHTTVLTELACGLMLACEASRVSNKQTQTSETAEQKGV